MHWRLRSAQGQGDRVTGARPALTLPLRSLLSKHRPSRWPCCVLATFSLLLSDHPASGLLEVQVMRSCPCGLQWWTKVGATRATPVTCGGRQAATCPASPAAPNWPTGRSLRPRGGTGARPSPPLGCSRACSPSLLTVHKLAARSCADGPGSEVLVHRGEGRGWGGKVRMFYGLTNGFCGVSVWFSPLRITVDLLGVQCAHVPSLPSHPAFTGTVCLGVGSSCWQSPRHPNATTLGRGPVSPRSCEAVVRVVSAGRQWVSRERAGIKTPVPAS